MQFRLPVSISIYLSRRRVLKRASAWRRVWIALAASWPACPSCQLPPATSFLTATEFTAWERYVSSCRLSGKWQLPPVRHLILDSNRIHSLAAICQQLPALRYAAAASRHFRPTSIRLKNSQNSGWVYVLCANPHIRRLSGRADASPLVQKLPAHWLLSCHHAGNSTLHQQQNLRLCSSEPLVTGAYNPHRRLHLQ